MTVDVLDRYHPADSPRWPGVLGSLLSLAGLAIAGYLTYAHYDSASVLACPDRGIVNCAKVTTSSWSTIGGVPVAVLGLVYFAVMTVLQHPRAWRLRNRSVRTLRLVAATGGVAAALWLLYVELFRLDAICLYCTAVHLLAFLLFVVTALGSAALPADGPDSGREWLTATASVVE